MIRILAPGQLAAAPADTPYESRITTDKQSWVHVINLSPYAFELQDDKAEVRGVVPWFGEAIIPLRIVSERVLLHAIATTTLAAPVATTSYAVYIDVTEDQQPLAVGKLAAT